MDIGLLNAVDIGNSSSESEQEALGLPEISSGSRRRANTEQSQPQSRSGKENITPDLSHERLSGELVIRMHDDDLGFPGDKQPDCQRRRHKRCRFDPWVRKIPWRRPWQPTPVFFPGESHGWRRLAGCSPWGMQRWTQLSVCAHTHTQDDDLRLTRMSLTLSANTPTGHLPHARLGADSGDQQRAEPARPSAFPGPTG